MGRNPGQLLLISESKDEVIFQIADGRRFKVSPCDKMFVVSLAWSMDKNGYVRCGSSKFYLKLLSRLLCLTSLEVDHKDRDPTNNSRDNLRPATRTQNQANSGSDAISGFKGVYARRNKFQAAISINYKKVHLGSFDTAQQAHTAYLKAATKLHGDFSCGG
jgi:hypothetical protein